MGSQRKKEGAARPASALLAFVVGAHACAAPRASTLSAPPGASAQMPPNTSAPPPDLHVDAGWVASEHPDLRKLTVLVRVKPPSELVAKYGELADHDKRLKPLFQAAAEGGFGSGFVLVLREPSDSGKPPALRRFVVTNWHVVDLSTKVTVAFEGSKASIEVPVVYVDPAYDLAVLSLDRATGDSSAMASIPSEGFGFASSPAKDQEPVVASGYPPIGTAPSYQVTRGYVSNERFESTEGGRKQLYVQHTAPIDPGSSGGPLTTPDGKLLGVNAMKVQRRENVGLAVPAAAVVEAVTRSLAAADVDRRASPTDARAACDALVAALSRGQDDLGPVERAIGGAMVAREGFTSLAELPRGDVAWIQAFVESPTQVLLHATALRLAAEIASTKGTSDAAPPTCAPIKSDAEATTASFRVPTRRGERTWTFGWEQQRWKLVSGSLSPPHHVEPFFRNGPPPQKKWTPSLK